MGQPHSPPIIWRIHLFICPGVKRTSHPLGLGPSRRHFRRPWKSFLEGSERRMGLLKGSAGLGGLESAPFRCDACAAGEREDGPRRVRSSETRTFTTQESVCAAAFVALLQLCAAINWLRWPVNIYMLEKPFLGFICMMVKCVMLCVCVWCSLCLSARLCSTNSRVACRQLSTRGSGQAGGRSPEATEQPGGNCKQHRERLQNTRNHQQDPPGISSQTNKQIKPQKRRRSR